MRTWMLGTLDADVCLHMPIPLFAFFGELYLSNQLHRETWRRHPSRSQRVGGGEPEGVRKHLLSKKVLLCLKKVFRF